MPNKTKTSIVTRLSLLFLTLAVVNLMVTWVFSGANQMRLISEKANLAGSSTAFEILRRLSGETRFDSARVHKLLRNVKNDQKMIVSEFTILTSEFEYVSGFPETQDRGISAEVSQNLLKALQLRDLSGQPFMTVPNITDFHVQLFIPLTSTGSRDFLLVTRLRLDSIPEDLKSLIRLLFATIALMLLIQVAIGFLIYRILIKPIRDVSTAAIELGGGKFTAIALPKRQRDEIYSLIESFNQMSDELRVKDETIRNQIDQLQEKNDVLDFELEIAERIQQSIMPDAQKLAAFGAAVEYVPLNRVSGDYYDFVRLEDGSVAVLIADASGHGVPAAFLTILMKVFYTDLVQKHLSASDLMLAINERASHYLEDTGFYLTAFYIRVYPDLRAEYCNCGHPAPLVIRSEGTLTELADDNSVIGLMSDIDGYKASEIQLTMTDKLLLFTDGLTELKNDKREFLSEEALYATLKSVRNENCQAIRGHVVELAREHQNGEKASDDLTLIVLAVCDLMAGPSNVAEPEKQNAGKDAVVARLLEQIVEVYDAPSYYALLINAKLKLGKIGLAREVLGRALKKHPESASLRLLAQRMQANPVVS